MADHRQELALGTVGLIGRITRRPVIAQIVVALVDQPADQPGDGTQVIGIFLAGLKGDAARAGGHADRADDRVGRSAGFALHLRSGLPQHGEGIGPILVGQLQVLGHPVEAVDQQAQFAGRFHCHARGLLTGGECRGGIGQLDDRP